ncbi:hemerythrin domain-containing protein [Nevskia sp.]|uniref:hemerythrin domain-containing protein n=1 Tax=Nevskia sp. TaxID=1929292 RepID=UPI0025D10EAF|nr:hemerythrin domain-containing protein [Nevskia sp.]
MLNTIKNKLDPRPNAISLLKDDHREVEALFSAYQEARDKRRQKSIVLKICEALEAHTKVEEKIFYPAIKQKKDLADMVNEAVVEHAGAKKLIRELKNGSPADELYDAKVTVLEEYIRHHVKEEESEMFPKVEATDLDLVELGERMSAAKERLLEAA